MTLSALLVSIVFASASLAWGYFRSGFGLYAIWILIFGAVWLLAVWRKWNWYSSIALLIYIVVAALGLWFEFNSSWMFAGGMLALFAWDVSDLRRRLYWSAKDDDTRGLERHHLIRISLLVLFGFLLASITLSLRVQFTFEWVAVFVIFALLGLGQLVRWLRR
ncbi:MAG: hypothetical protein IPJ46_02585 [Anaerolineales bacterium]|nr:hypothetical protein [Anaerolineales bacterium]